MSGAKPSGGDDGNYSSYSYSPAATARGAAASLPPARELSAAERTLAAEAFDRIDVTRAAVNPTPRRTAPGHRRPRALPARRTDLSAHAPLTPVGMPRTRQRNQDRLLSRAEVVIACRQDARVRELLGLPQHIR